MSPNPIRAEVGHPIIDVDGHMIESFDLFATYLDEVGGPQAVDRYRAELAANPVGSFGDRERGDPRTGFWGFPNDARDVATAMIPELMYERMEELGFDYAVIYPSMGIPATTIQDPDIRQAAVRAENLMNAERYAPFADRLTPAAALPVHTPHEAIAELRHVREELGLKVAVMPAGVARPIPAYPEAFPAACFVDRFGLDSSHDYDPLWRTFVELGVPVSTHVGAALRYLPTGRHSPTNFCFNHIGAHAYAQAELCRSLLMGGVPLRFPELVFTFLEGGVDWAITMLESTIEHWAKRNIDALRANLDPAGLDQKLFHELVARYGSGSFARIGVDGVKPPGGNFATSRTMASTGVIDRDEELDEWAASGIKGPRDIVRPFVESFFFGSEAEDRGVVRAAREHHEGGPRLRPVFGSDIGHYDVPSMRDVLAESYELVEHGHLQPDDWRAFVFDDPARYLTAMDPDFFGGTAVEDAVADLRAGKDS